jgi:endonuclease/exonuclease/phosphatase family metal-dependent hydrolase
VDARRLCWFVAALTAMTLELVRSTGPLMDSLYSSSGMQPAILVAVATYAGPGVVVAGIALALRVLPQHDGTVVLVAPAALLVALRLAAQAAPPGAKVGITMAAIAVSLAALVLAVAALASCAGGQRDAAAALSTGLALFVLTQLVLGTWDAFWRDSLLGWTVSGLISLAVIGTAVAASRRDRDVVALHPRRVWALGSFLALATLITANPAFVASQAEVALLVAGGVAAVGLVLAAAVGARAPDRPALTITVVTAAVLVVAVAALLQVPRAASAPAGLVLAGVVMLQVACALSMRGALQPRQDEEAAVSELVIGGRTVVAATVAGLSAIVPMMLYQIEYRTPLGFPNYLSLTAAALLLGAAGVRGRPAVGRSSRRRTQRLLVVGLSATAVTLAAVGVRPWTTPDRRLDSPGPADTASVRIMSWNVHYAVDGSGIADLEAVAGAVERHDPDVLVLNEVSRGWLIGGGTDDAAWLAQRLGGHWAFAPSADRQFGSMILSRWPLADVRRIELPQGTGTQARSMVAATVTSQLGDLTVVAVHLEDGAGRAAVRLQQLTVLLPALEAMDAAPLVFAGDLNAAPSDEEIATILRAGFVSAIDDVGDPGALTQPSDAPHRRIDWVFGRGVRFQDADVLYDERASDHLPVLTTLVP